MDIEIKNVSVSYPSSIGAVQVLRNATITLPAHRITALVGESGSGKSVLGEALAGLLERDASVWGDILYNGENLLALSDEEMNRVRGREIGWIAQNPVTAMNPMMKVGKQVCELFCFLSGRSAKEEKNRTLKQLADYGLSDASVYERYPSELSGGMAQRAVTAATAMSRPSWIIADEPTKGLDAFVRKQVCDLFKNLKEEGTGFLLITHDLRVAKSLSDYTAIMYAGEIVEWGRTERIFSHPLHPYTQKLLDAQPSRGMKPIRGEPVNLSRVPDGCIFATRCDRYRKRFCDDKQKLICGEREHSVRCCGERGES